ncbi:cupin domain-containing protein [Microvirga sp. VF16]|uniref:cupin domain-containing protein n=1 Tax=Microvirga sp. VF16 TaxID=2807101 RepID=UPI00193D50DC|nr:cupin domain-containing protein [Microvirga sp. VF16]QRM30742.1 cupin domain-containing protein [Microvirga sp. VF16]
MAQAKGYGDPQGYNAPLGTETYVFRNNGIVPNSPLPLIVRRGAISPSDHDPVRTFKTTFAKNGWTNAWLNGIHDYHHYHSNTHEVLGIVSGTAQVRFGGEDGDLVAVSARDVVIIPAGVAHACINASDDFSVVGAYPGGADYDTIRDDPGTLAISQQRIAQIPLPDSDPVDGADGPLMKLWS